MKQATAFRIWKFIQSRGPRGAIADEVLVRFPELGHTNVTARIRGLKHAGLLVRHPEKILRKTRARRHAEVWVAHGTEFKSYREPGPRLPKKQNVAAPQIISLSCNHTHVTDAELELLALARSYAQLEASGDDDRLNDVTDRLFNKILKVYAVPKKMEAANIQA
jgi:hypothetical protein